MNRKGDFLMFLPFLALMLIVGAGIVLGVSGFYNRGYDTRAVEAEMLLARVEQCLHEHDFFDENFSISLCRLNEGVLSENHLIYLTRSDGAEYSLGVDSYRTSCFLKGTKNSEYSPRCLTVDGTARGQRYTLLVGSSQRGMRGVQ